MQLIKPPIKPGDKGAAVVNLQDALQLLLDRQIINPQLAPNRPTLDELKQLAARLKQERTASTFGEATRQLVHYFQLQQILADNLLGVVEEKTAAKLNELLTNLGALTPDVTPSVTDTFVVRGLATSRGLAVPGVTIRVLDMDVRRVTDISHGGQPGPAVVTDAWGNYLCKYTRAQFGDAEMGSADLIFQLRDSQGRSITSFVAKDAAGKPLQTINLSVDTAGKATLVHIKPNADRIEVVNFDIAAGVVVVPSEYERLLAILEPLLIYVQPVDNPTLLQRIADLKAPDLEFLVLETSVARERLDKLVASVLAARALGMDDDLAVYCFGLACEDLTLDLAGLARTSVQKRQGALAKAFTDNVIPASRQDGAAGFLDRLQTFLAAQALKTPLRTGGGSLGDLLNLAGLSADLQTQFALAQAKHEGTTEEFWKGLRANQSFQQPGVVDRIQLSFQVALLTQNHVPLFAALNQQYKPQTIRDLTKLDRAAWTALVQQNGVGVPDGTTGATPAEQTSNYVEGIVGTLNAAMPTGTIARIVASQTPINMDAKVRANIGKFLDNSLDFDIRTTVVDRYVRDKGANVFGDLPGNDRTNVIEGLKRAQRLFLCSTGEETLTALMATELGSARDIARIPRASFIATYADTLGGVTSAQDVHDRALHIHTRARLAVTHLRQSLTDIAPGMITSADDIKSAINEVLNYA